MAYAMAMPRLGPRLGLGYVVMVMNYIVYHNIL